MEIFSELARKFLKIEQHFPNFLKTLSFSSEYDWVISDLNSEYWDNSEFFSRFNSQHPDNSEFIPGSIRTIPNHDTDFRTYFRNKCGKNMEIHQNPWVFKKIFFFLIRKSLNTPNSIFRANIRNFLLRARDSISFLQKWHWAFDFPIVCNLYSE